MSARWDENLDEAYGRFRQNHDALRDRLMASLPPSVTKKERLDAARRLRRFSGDLVMNSKLRKTAIAAAILIAVLFGLHYLGGSPVGTTIAWAEVLKNVEAARTVMYTEEFEKSGDKKEIATVRIMEPYLLRSDIIQGSGNYSVGITDTQKSKCLTFYPRTKTVVVGHDIGYPSGYQLRNYEELKRDLRDGTEKDLGRVKLNGRDTVCFEISRKNGKTTVWADPNTALPVQIETLSEENGRTRMLMSDIRFDIELEDRLFEPPADYCILDLETQRLTTPFALTEQHLLEGLAVYPKYLDGKFRTRYAGGRPLTDEVKKKIAAEAAKLNWSEEEAHKSTLGCAFAEQLPEGSDYQYVGEDVKLGDATKAVCWWKPPGSKTYRVVYGDLSIRDVEPDRLPPVPWLVEQK